MQSNTTQNRASQGRISGELELLKVLAGDMPMEKLLDAIAQFIEQESVGVRCSILLVDEATKKLRIGSAKSLPDTYSKLVDKISIAQGEGVSETVCHNSSSIYVTNLQTDTAHFERKRADGLCCFTCWNHS